MRQAPNVERLLCMWKFMSQVQHFQVTSCVRNYVCCSHLLKTYFYLFKRVNKVFFLQNDFSYKSRNLIYVVICQGWEEE